MYKNHSLSASKSVSEAWVFILYPSPWYYERHDYLGIKNQSRILFCIIPLTMGTVKNKETLILQDSSRHKHKMLEYHNHI